ncbi:MAG: hypothetical protein B6D55_04395 [Candidatus Omnitrophica bacterium 4484_70.2]|nr:MAG: hypothetical protein B6D55_04395 [Candidatus Omnitrophica bacterium 4484_70.2]
MISKRIENLKPSGIREFFELVLETKGVISLGVGEPDFDTPWNVREKGIWSLEEGLTSYTSNKGLLQLRKQISLYLKHRYGVYYDPQDEILITVGVSEGLDLCIRALVDEGDRVIVCSPYYVAYPAIVKIQGGEVLYLHLKKEEDFKINIGELKKMLKYRPKAIILNYPANPTGVSYTRKELYQIWKALKDTDCLVISDEIYSELSYDFCHTCFSSFKGAKSKTLLLGGFSKNYSMTGFRIGFVCGSSSLISALTKIHQYTILCAPTVSQFSALEALKIPLKEMEAIRREYARRREFIIKELKTLGWDVVYPQGAFYCFADIKRDGFKFAKDLLLKKKVALVPGEAFGEEFTSYVRITYAQNLSLLKEAVERIREFVNQ